MTGNRQTVLTPGLDLGNFYLCHKRQIIAQIGITGGAGLDGGDVAIAEQAQELAQMASR